MIEAPKEDVHCKGSALSYACGKVREHDTFILFDPGSTHNFNSLELATELGVQDFEMGDAMKVDGAFIGQDVSVTPLIGKLRLHIQGYVDKEDFFISPLKHEDVILGAPWFDRLAASIRFPKRKISFKFRENDMYINAQELGSTIPLVNDQAFDKSIKSSFSTYMIFVKDSLNGINETQLDKFLPQCQPPRWYHFRTPPPLQIPSATALLQCTGGPNSPFAALHLGCNALEGQPLMELGALKQLNALAHEEMLLFKSLKNLPDASVL
ncbi:hypothetical protein L7F22_044752 [Adiantum nelumboides]|nr:hypothetical protein [Adiantum nelumboides]